MTQYLIQFQFQINGYGNKISDYASYSKILANLNKNKLFKLVI